MFEFLRNKNFIENILFARQRAGDSQHVGGRIGAAGAGFVRAVPGAGGGRLAGVSVHRRGGIDPGHAAQAGRYSTILSTLVPMFCSEMDGLEPLQNVVVYPGLKPGRSDRSGKHCASGRIDRKIKVNRPTQEGARADIRDLSQRDTAAVVVGPMGAGKTVFLWPRCQRRVAVCRVW